MGVVNLCKSLKNLWDASKKFANNLATVVKKGWDAAKDWIANFKDGFNVLTDVLESDRSVLEKVTMGLEIAYNMTSLNKLMSPNDVVFNAKKLILNGQKEFITATLKGAQSTIDPEITTSMLNNFLTRVVNATERKKKYE